MDINKKNTLFTIVVCTYNGEKYLEQCLTAITALTRLEDFVDKVYVVDNNSTDNTKSIIQAFEKKCKLFKYEFEARQGLSFAREHAVKAITDWIIYVDDDNILDTNWLIALNKTIHTYPHAGVINGAVIAKPVEKLSKQQQAILKAMYKNLACTHLNLPQIGDPPIRVPMGAGMCVRTASLRKIEQNGWLNLVGRTKNVLSSGEDTELCTRIFAQGYGYASSFDMKLFHLIPSERLDEEYIFRLINGLVMGRVDFIKSQKFWTLKLFLRKIKYMYLLPKYKRDLLRLNPSDFEYWDDKVQIYQAEAFLHALSK